MVVCIHMIIVHLFVPRCNHDSLADGKDYITLPGIDTMDIDMISLHVIASGCSHNLQPVKDYITWP